MRATTAGHGGFASLPFRLNSNSTLVQQFNFEAQVQEAIANAVGIDKSRQDARRPPQAPYGVCAAQLVVVCRVVIQSSVATDKPTDVGYNAVFYVKAENGKVCPHRTAASALPHRTCRSAESG